MKKVAQFIRGGWLRKHQPLAVGIGFGLFSMVVLGAAQAATPTASLEAEDGTVGTSASIVTDTSASGGQVVKFNAAGSGATCSNPTHTPGGSDGMGGCWPYAGNTGIPAGVTLSAYSGPCTITSGNSGPSVTINAKNATACGILAIYDVNVTIINSRVPVIDRTNSTGSVTLTDSEAVGAGWVGGVLWGSNITATRVEVTGAQHSVHCEANCTITDSYLHGQEAPAGQPTHNNAFITNGGNNMTVRHNTLHCSPEMNGADGGCTADVALLGDFAPVEDITIDKNLFHATPSGGYCGNFGHNPGKPFPTTANIRVTDNIFQRGSNNKCGVFNAVTSFAYGNGNVWTNNTWDNGGAVAP